ncbi:MAG: hypothetical protein J7480_10565, partial [Microbacteriaceae bacterium]|nr:hypothetical protein [Microbacteriaceae bacterium]
HATDVRARRLVDGDVRPADEQEHLSARLVSYSDEPTVWISVETRTSPPLEIALTDANRWVMALGATMVDEGARLR